MAERPKFSSRITMVLTLIGVAVGLGNVWRFPYMMGKYGGSAFLLIYLLFTILFAVPALMGEISFGRATKEGLFGAFSQALGKGWGRLIGILLLITILVASSYYAIIIANVFYSSYFSLVHRFTTDTLESYLSGLGNSSLQYAITFSVIITSLMVLYRGLNKGIEWVSKIFVPFFLVVIVFLIYYTFTIDGAKAHFLNFLKPDFTSLEPVHVFAALGQAFYSLSLGGTFMVVYGTYLNKNISIPKTAAWTAFGDIGAALLTSLFIVPAVLVFNLDMTSGPTLIFNTLPQLFSQIPGGQFIGSIFLLALSLVAFLSLVAALEVAFSCFKEIFKLKFTRLQLLLGIGLIELILVIPSILDTNLIGTLDLIFGSGMQLLGSGITMIALAWGLGKIISKTQLFQTNENRHFNLLFFWMKWVIPAVLAIVLIGYIYDSIT